MSAVRHKCFLTPFCSRVSCTRCSVSTHACALRSISRAPRRAGYSGSLFNSAFRPSFALRPFFTSFSSSSVRCETSWSRSHRPTASTSCRDPSGLNPFARAGGAPKRRQVRTQTTANQGVDVAWVDKERLARCLLLDRCSPGADEPPPARTARKSGLSTGNPASKSPVGVTASRKPSRKRVSLDPLVEGPPSEGVRIRWKRGCPLFFGRRTPIGRHFFSAPVSAMSKPMEPTFQQT